MIKWFALRAIGWVIVLLTVWYWVALWVAPPLTKAAGLLMHTLFPEWVQGVGWEKRVAVLFTDLALNPVGEIKAKRFESRVSVTHVGIGAPFFIALLLAARVNHLLFKIFGGSLILFVFAVAAILVSWLGQVLMMRGPFSAVELGFSGWQVSIAIFLDQFLNITVLLLPILIWLAFERRFAEDIFWQKSNKQK